VYDDQDFEQDHGLFDRLLPVAGVGVILAIVGVGGWWVFDSMTGEGLPPPPQVQEISLVKPPPPPPPPPPEEEPMEEPEMEEEEVDIPEPEKVMEDLPEPPGDEPPPGTELGLDAEGGAGGDGFGLVGRKGSRGLLSGGGGFGWYRGIIEQEILGRLSEVEELRRLGYTVVVRVWLAPDGSVETTELERGTGDAAVDLKLRNALTDGFRLSEAPPDDLPQPIRLRIDSRT